MTSVDNDTFLAWTTWPPVQEIGGAYGLRNYRMHKCGFSFEMYMHYMPKKDGKEGHQMFSK